MSNSYELTYILPLKYTETEIPQIINQINEIIKKNQAAITHEENWGKKKIAYPIKQNRHGYFVVSQIKTESKNLKKLKKDLSTAPEIIRYSITRFKPGSFESKKEIKPQEPKPIKEKTLPKEISLPKEKQAPKAKVALEDLDKKLDELLSDEALDT